MFPLITVSVASFVAARVVLPLPCALALRVAIILIVLIVSQHHVLSRVFYGTMFSPEVPRPLMIVLNLLFGAMVLAFAFQLVADLVTLLVALCRRRWQLPPATLQVAVAALSLGLAGWAVAQAIRVPQVKRFELALPALPPQFDGYRLVHLTDLHLSKLFPRTWAEAVVARTNALDPDLIAISGDLIDGQIAARRADVAPLADLRARDGVHVSPGNHEYYYDYTAWMGRYAELGMTVLANDHRVLRRDGAELVLAGVTDRAAQRFGLPTPDLAAALTDAPKNAPIVLLDHQPRFARANAQAGVDLQLSGHTHGGMILGFDRLVARFNAGFVSGLYELGDMRLYVSNGTGLWMGFALRLGKPPEITEITLRAARSGGS